MRIFEKLYFARIVQFGPLCVNKYCKLQKLRICAVKVADKLNKIQQYSDTLTHDYLHFILNQTNR